MYVVRTGCAWRYLPGDFPQHLSADRQCDPDLLATRRSVL
jgi:transposase